MQKKSANIKTDKSEKVDKHDDSDIPPRPKRPMNGYFLFAQDKKDEVKKSLKDGEKL